MSVGLEEGTAQPRESVGICTKSQHNTHYFSRLLESTACHLSVMNNVLGFSDFENSWK